MQYLTPPNIRGPTLNDYSEVFVGYIFLNSFFIYTDHTKRFFLLWSGKLEEQSTTINWWTEHLPPNKQHDSNYVTD
jgi:hypothetical protein